MKQTETKWTVFKSTMKPVFGVYFNQPLHVTLNNFRIVSIISLVLSWLMLWDIWFYLESVQLTDKEQFIMGVLALAGTMLGTIWKAVNHIQERIRKDEH